MDEVLRDIRQIVIDHVRDILHVNAARSQIRGDQHSNASLLKSSQGRRALRLRTSAVNHRGSNSFAVQALGQPLGPVLRAHENQAASLFFSQQAVQHSEFPIARNFESLQLNVFRRLQYRPKSEPHRIPHVIVHQVRDRSFQRC